MNQTTKSMKFFHVGVLVRDLEKALKFYEAIPGYEPFAQNEVTFTKEEVTVGAPMTLKIAVGEIGGIGYELIEPVSPGSYQQDAIDARGELIHHLAYICPDNFDEVVHSFKAEGYKLAWAGCKDGVNIAFYEASDGAMIFELLSKRPF